MFIGLDIFGVLGDPDALALAATLWLQDIRLVLLLASVGLKVTITKTQNNTQSVTDINMILAATLGLQDIRLVLLLASVGLKVTITKTQNNTVSYRYQYNPSNHSQASGYTSCASSGECRLESHHN